MNFHCQMSDIIIYIPLWLHLNQHDRSLILIRINHLHSTLVTFKFQSYRTQKRVCLHLHSTLVTFKSKLFVIPIEEAEYLHSTLVTFKFHATIFFVLHACYLHSTLVTFKWKCLVLRPWIIPIYIPLWLHLNPVIAPIIDKAYGFTFHSGYI